jgi:hypothetical protein
MLRYSRNVILLSAIVFFLVLAALSQTGDENKTYQLAGAVVNSVTGRPIPRVLVRLSATRRNTLSLNRSVLTGTEGDFSFNNVPPGMAEILLTKPGYFYPGASSSSYAPYRADNAPYKVEVGPDTGNVVLKLAPQAVITGTIQGNDEEPLEGVRVSIFTSQVIEGRRQLVPTHGATLSDEDGNFRITGLVQGRYYLSAAAGRVSRTILGAQSQNGGETYPPIVYFPDGNDLASAEPLDLATGQHQDVRLTLKTVPSFKVAGAIANPGDWKRLNAPALVDEFQQPLISADRFEGRSGVFEFRAVPAGTYWLQLGGMNREGRYTATYRRLAVHSNVAELRLTVQPSLDIPIILHADFVHEKTPRGHCRFTSDSGEAQESDCSDYPDARIELHSLDFPRLQFQSDSGPLKAAFSIRGVSPGQYSVRAQATFGGYIESARCGGVDLLREPLVVPEDGNVCAIEIVVRDDPATMKIQVRTEKPGQQALVLVFPDPVTVTDPQIRADSQGGEVYAGPLAPGAYKVFAFDAAAGFDYPSLDELAKYSAQATSVKVGANESANVVVDLIRIGE